MARFRQEFAAQLPARLDEARQLLAAWRDAPADDVRLRDLHRCVHKLAGTAGTFGQAQVSADARAIEDRLDALLARPDRDAAALDEVQDMFEALARRTPAA
jgi:HPt (histidine-containing phosphotransfer) domain-containing protein